MEKTEEKEKLLSFLKDADVEEISRVQKAVQTAMTYYRCALLEVETKFRVLNERFSLEKERNPIENIKSRVKSLESIRKKLAKKGLPLTVQAIEEHLSDVAGIRVICSFTEDLYLLAGCLLCQDDVKLIAVKDYIRAPKENGYRSLHLIVEIPIFLHDEKRQVKVEVQLRTIAMENWAQLEHRLRYKKDVPPQILQKAEGDLKACAELSQKLDETMQNIRVLIEGADGEREGFLR